MTKTADQIVDEIVAKLQLAGTFDAAKMSLIERYAACVVEQHRIFEELRRQPPGLIEARRLGDELASLTQEELQLSLELELPENNVDGAMPGVYGLWIAASWGITQLFTDLPAALL